MKIIAYILVLTIFGLSIYPCSHGLHCDEEQETTSHNHSENEEENCPPFCVCVCCGSTYIESKVKTIEPIIEQVNYLFTFHYSFHYSFSYQSTVWHPPAFC